MKKIFAILLSLAMLFCFNTRTEATSLDSKITLEIIEKMSSWKELTDTMLPLPGSSINIEYPEDDYTISLINSICCNKKSVHVYHDQEYISTTITHSLKNVNYDRLIQKYQAIIGIYNSYNDLQLTLEYNKEIGDHYLSIHVESDNVADLCRPAINVGQQVLLKADSKCWESASSDGSGKSFIITDNTPVTVNGVAYLDDSDQISETYYKPYDQLEGTVDIKIWKKRMLHICTAETDLGWVWAESIVSLD